MSSESTFTVRIIFPLAPDEDGYPPASEESVHAIPIKKNTYKINNIPFFIYGVNFNDIVSAIEKDGRLVFEKLIKSSGHFTYRLIFEKNEEIQSIRNKLRKMGCQSEGSHLPSLISVDVPPNIDRKKILSYLDTLQENGIADYEDSIYTPP